MLLSVCRIWDWDAWVVLPTPFTSCEGDSHVMHIFSAYETSSQDMLEVIIPIMGLHNHNLIPKPIRKGGIVEETQKILHCFEQRASFVAFRESNSHATISVLSLKLGQVALFETFRMFLTEKRDKFTFFKHMSFVFIKIICNVYEASSHNFHVFNPGCQSSLSKRV